MKKHVLFSLLSLLVFAVQPVAAEQSETTLGRAKGETLAQAVGHYARSRALLIQAIREFDSGARLADPSALLETSAWRDDLLDRARDLERVLDPQPRVTEGGVRYSPDPRLLAEAN